MSLVEFIEANIISDNPLVTAICIGILFGAFFEFYHILSSAVFCMFRRG